MNYLKSILLLLLALSSLNCQELVMQAVLCPDLGSSIMSEEEKIEFALSNAPLDSFSSFPMPDGATLVAVISVKDASLVKGDSSNIVGGIKLISVIKSCEFPFDVFSYLDAIHGESVCISLDQGKTALGKYKKSTNSSLSGSEPALSLREAALIVSREYVGDRIGSMLFRASSSNEPSQ